MLLLLVDAVVVSFCIWKIPASSEKNLRKQKVNKLNFVVSVFKSCSGHGRIMDACVRQELMENHRFFMVLFAFHSVSRSFVEYTAEIYRVRSKMWLAASNWPCHRDDFFRLTQIHTQVKWHFFRHTFILPVLLHLNQPLSSHSQLLYSPIQVAEEGHYEITNALNEACPIKWAAIWPILTPKRLSWSSCAFGFIFFSSKWIYIWFECVVFAPFH